MRTKHRAWAALVAGTAWVGGFAAQAGDGPAGSLASATGVNTSSTSFAGATSAVARSSGRLDRSMADASDTPQPSTTEPSVPAAQTTAVGASESQATRSTASAATNASRQPGYEAGGSMSGSTAVSQAYAQTTQSGWGCQAALQYLSQHANPQFQLVCPGYAMGHQAMTCYYLQGTCPNTAEIVIADPCPAAYENEAWNSWHMGTGPYDPYGWCSDWSERAPIMPTPQPLGAAPSAPAP